MVFDTNAKTNMLLSTDLRVFLQMSLLVFVIQYIHFLSHTKSWSDLNQVSSVVLLVLSSERD